MKVGPPSPDGSDGLPQPFGRYTLLQKLAVGGMGELFLARVTGPEGTEQLLVIKKLRPELAGDPEFTTRFADEARTLLQLQHENIARVQDHGQVDGAAFIALEFVDGKDLKAVLARCQERQTRIPTAIALHLAIRVLDALAYAHARTDEQGQPLNLVHRDISPPNILLGYDGRVKVIDFGLAKTAMSVQRTQTGALLGKLLYMPPESVRRLPLDKRADLFCLAVVLHETLSGRHLLEGLAAGEVMTQMADPHFPPLAGVVPGVSAQLDATLQRALSADRERRQQSAEELRGELSAALHVLAPGFGPESIVTFLRNLFAHEYAEERARLRQLRELAGMRRWSAEQLAVGDADTGKSLRPVSGTADTLLQTAPSAERPRPGRFLSPTMNTPPTEPEREAYARPDTAPAGLPPAGELGTAKTQDSRMRALQPAPLARPDTIKEEPSEPRTERELDAAPDDEPAPATQPEVSSNRAVWIAVGVMLLVAVVLAFLAWGRAQSAPAQQPAERSQPAGDRMPERRQPERGPRERQVQVPGRPR